jgi:hypothetical protein
VLKAMSATKLKLAALLFIAVVVLGAATTRAFSPRSEDSPGQPPNAAAVPLRPQPDNPAGARDLMKEGQANYLICSVTTDLQRALVAGGGKQLQAYVVVNGRSLLREDAMVDPKAIDFDGLRKALKPRATKDGVVCFHMFLPGTSNGQGENLLTWTFEGFSRHAGFGRAFVTSTYDGGFHWQETLASVAKRMGGKPDADEPSSGDEAVKVYPVRTVLSRFLCGNADCVVRINVAFDAQSDGSLDAKVDKAIRAYVGKLMLAQKDKVLFQVRVKQGGRDAALRFNETTARELEQALGFAASSVTHQFE